MKTNQSETYPSIHFFKYIIHIITILILVFSLIRTSINTSNNKIKGSTSVNAEYLFTSNQILTKFSTSKIEVINIDKEIKETKEQKVKTQEEKEVIEIPIIYEGLTEDQLAEKLNRSLNSTLSGTGTIFARYTANTGLDPYLAVAIVLHETGCKWNCSDLVNTCYNVGGVKGAPGCYGGSYKAYSSLEEGINAYLDNLYYNYYARGLTVPETINPYYAESTTWAQSVDNYINEIRNT